MASSIERAILSTPLPTGRAGLATPFQFTFTGEDRLRVAVSCIVPNAVVVIQGRIYQPDGTTIQVFKDSFIPVTGLDESTHDVEIGAGSITNLVVRVGNAFVQHGECFVRVDLIRGVGNAATVLGTLISGYVGSWGGRAWPGSVLDSPTEGPGVMRVLTDFAPAVGQPPVLNFVGTARYRLIAASFTHTASGVGAARRLYLQLLVGGVPLFLLESSITQAAGSTVFHSWATGVNRPTVAGAITGEGSLPVDCTISVPDGSSLQLRGVIVNEDAADQATAITVLAEEWRNPRTAFVV